MHVLAVLTKARAAAWLKEKGVPSEEGGTGQGQGRRLALLAHVAKAREAIRCGKGPGLSTSSNGLAS